MAETRRAMVTIIQQGDPEIAGALVAGVMAGRVEAERRGATSSDPTLRVGPPDARKLARAYGPPEGEGFEENVETVEVYTAGADKWRRVARQVRVAVGRNLTAEDYRLMIVKARCEYAVHRHTGPAHTVARKLLLAWVMVCQAMRRAYRAQERVLK